MGPFLFYLGGKLIINRLNKANTVSDTVSDQSIEQANSIYRGQIGLGKGFKFDGTTFDKFVKDRQASIADLPTIFKDPKIKDALADPTVQAALAGALSDGKDSPTTKTVSTAAQSDYEKQTQFFNSLLKRIPPLKVEAVLRTMKETIDKGIQDIQKHQQFEKESLSKLFDPVPPAKTSPFVDKLTEKGVTDIEAAKKAMISDLDIKHETQLDAFKQATLEPVNKIHKASQKDFADFSMVSALSDSNPEMEKIIRIIAGEKQAAQEKELETLNKNITAKTKEMSTADAARKTQLKAEIEEAKAIRRQIEDKFKGLTASMGTDEKAEVGEVRFSDLKVIHSKTGNKITQGDDGTLTLNIGAMLNPFGSPVGYFMGNKIEHDMGLLAEGIRAQGKTSIVMTVNYSNEDVARQRAKQAYQASINAGFPPEKIEIKMMVNGKKVEWKPEDAFSDDQMKSFKSRATEVNKSREEAYEKFRADTNPVKAELVKLKEEHEAKEKDKEEALESVSSLFPEQEEAVDDEDHSLSI